MDKVWITDLNAEGARLISIPLTTVCIVMLIHLCKQPDTPRPVETIVDSPAGGPAQTR